MRKSDKRSERVGKGRRERERETHRRERKKGGRDLKSLKRHKPYLNSEANKL